jgi:hypothetical protein
MTVPWLTGEVFVHTDTDGTVRHFALPLLRQSILDAPRAWHDLTLPIDPALAAEIATSGGVEEARVKAYPMAKIDQPGIGCLFADGKLLLVDGNHRLVKRARLGFHSMRVMACGEAVWKTCLVKPGATVTIR